MMTASRIACIALAGVVGGFVPAQAALLGVAPGPPTLVFNSQGVTTYDSETDLFAVDASPVAIRFTPFGLPVFVLPTGDPATEAVTIRIHVDQSGAFTGGVAEADLVVIGQVDQDGDSIPEFSGVLLTGEAAAFGFQEISSSTGIFDFRFAVTGGAMASEFGGGAIGVTLASEHSNFPGGFARSFSGGAKGNIGPIAFRCGDNFVDGGEQCDDGANNSDTEPNACRTDCTRPACGDGVVDAGEQCDDGANNSDTEPNACRTDCTRPAYDEGCTPGYWKNHVSVWDGVDANDKTATIKTSNLFNAKFGVTGSQSGVANCMTLLAALNLPKTTSSCPTVGERNNERLALNRHAVAALASADSGINYPYTVAQVIALYRDAVGADAGPETISSAHEKLSDANELGCPF